MMPKEGYYENFLQKIPNLAEYLRLKWLNNKADKLKGIADILIDDSWFNVQQCLSVGFPALLITRPHNKWVKTKYRVSHLNYKEIENKYNELFR